jgi:hypothetical protein
MVIATVLNQGWAGHALEHYRVEDVVQIMHEAVVGATFAGMRDGDGDPWLP